MIKRLFKFAIAALLVVALGASVPLQAQSTPASPGVLRNAYLLIRLQGYLNNANESYSSLQQKMEEARSEINKNRDRILTLEGQLQHLERLIEESDHKISNVEEQIQVKEGEIAELMEAIEFNEVERLDQGRRVTDYLKLLYFEKTLYFDSDNRANGLKIFLQGNTLSTVFQNGTYLRILELQTENILKQLEAIEFEIKASNVELVNKRQQLRLLRLRLDGEHRNLEAEIEGKKNLLEQTRGGDEIYRELFASYKLAQEVILQDINLFHTNIDALDDRIATWVPQLTAEDLEQVDSIRSEATRNFGIRTAAEFLKLDWPVRPSLGLTAFFEDSEYVARFGVQHNALDIPVPHNTIFYAPADGVVYKVYDAAALEDPKERLGYGYLIVAHRKGVMTLYGHIGASLVKEGDFVKRGQVLGLTGGTPGTPGAGLRTTGAHLHFEVIQDGIRVDPLEYLPLDVIPENQWNSIPERYLKMIQEYLADELEEEGFDPAALAELETSGQLDALSEELTGAFTDELPLELEVQETLESLDTEALKFDEVGAD